MVEQTLVGQQDASPSSAYAPYVYPVTNEYRQQVVSGGLPPYTEMTRRGLRWKTFTATPFAPIVAYPTTLANLEVVNNTTAFNFVVDTLAAWQLLGTAVVWAINVWGSVGPAVYSGNTALVISSGNGGTAYASAATTALKTAITQTVVANGWEMFPGSGSQFGLAAATPGGGVIGQVDGRLIVPPGRSLYVAVTGSVATASSVQCLASGHLVAITNAFV